MTSTRSASFCSCAKCVFRRPSRRGGEVGRGSRLGGLGGLGEGVRVRSGEGWRGEVESWGCQLVVLGWVGLGGQEEVGVG